MLSFIKKQINNLFYFFRPIFQKLNFRKIVVFKVDGGTSSQINDYLCMKFLEEATGRKVYAEMSFYKYQIEDDMSPVARPYNMDLLFEFQPFPVATWFMERFYPIIYTYKLSDVNLTNAILGLPRHPVYFGGYYSLNDNIRMHYFKRYLKIKQPEQVLDDKGIYYYQKIIRCEKKSIGVHVRRGDMAYAWGYWKVHPPEFFINISKINELQDFTFFFFSEEPLWIKENILPYISVNYVLVNANNSYYGYRDLYLLSRCQHQVKSQGSFGEYAYLMNSNEGKKLYYFDEKSEKLWGVKTM